MTKSEGFVFTKQKTLLIILKINFWILFILQKETPKVSSVY